MGLTHAPHTRESSELEPSLVIAEYTMNSRMTCEYDDDTLATTTTQVQGAY